MTTDTMTRIGAVVAAVALISAPHWHRIAALLIAGWTAAKPYRAEIARAIGALILVGVAFSGTMGILPDGMKVLPSDPWAAARMAGGACAVAYALFLIGRRIHWTLPSWTQEAVILAAGVYLLTGAPLPKIGVKLPAVISKPTAAVYVYEKDATQIHPSILAALDRINRERNIPATLFEVDTTDGTGETPEQYKTAVAAAKNATLPAFVILSGTTVISAESAPKELIVP